MRSTIQLDMHCISKSETQQKSKGQISVHLQLIHRAAWFQIAAYEYTGGGAENPEVLAEYLKITEASVKLSPKPAQWDSA